MIKLTDTIEMDEKLLDTIINFFNIKTKDIKLGGSGLTKIIKIGKNNYVGMIIIDNNKLEFYKLEKGEKNNYEISNYDCLIVKYSEENTEVKSTLGFYKNFKGRVFDVNSELVLNELEGRN